MRIKFNYYFIKFVYIIIDVICIYNALFVACLVRKGTVSFPITFQGLILDPANSFRFIFLLWIVTAVFFANANRLYETRREVFEGVEIWTVIKSVFQTSLVVIVSIYTLKITGFPRTILAVGSGFMAASMALWRILKRFLVDYLVSRGYNNFNVLIIGAGKVGVSLAEEIQRRPNLGLKVVGFLDDFKTGDPGGLGIKILGKISDFGEVVQRGFITKIYITIHHDSKVFLSLLQQSRDRDIAVRVIPQGFNLITGDLIRYNIGFLPILEYSNFRNIRRQVGKRTFDFLASLFALTLLSPVFVIVGIIIKLDSPGPVFYRSKRYGRKGKIFYMYKFRSMVKDAEHMMGRIRHKNEVDGPIFKIKKDPRITKAGQLLRKHSLDELPQLLNVLKGEMSLVGPRPFPIEQIERHDLRQYQRLEIRPGITGLWQIRGRSDVPFSRLIKWDIWYMNNWSFWLDLNILFLTIPVVYKGKGAY